MKLIFSDFDGTLTLDHEVGMPFIQVLELLKSKNKELIIVSGRSISWGHFYLTHFPVVTAAIMEGGGVIVTRKTKELFHEENLVSDDNLLYLENTTKELKQKFPWLNLTKDSFGRRTDRAIELVEYSESQKLEIEAFLTKKNIHNSRSNVHINFWAGDVSKYKAVEHYLKNYRPDISLDDCIYFGDAPNDESMFRYFKNSVGVSNIDQYLPQIKHQPKVILKGQENRGTLGVLNYLLKIL